MTLVVRKIKCDVAGCLGHPPKTRKLNDQFRSTVCAREGCMEVVSYEKSAIEKREAEKSEEVKEKKKVKSKEKTQKAQQVKMDLFS